MQTVTFWNTNRAPIAAVCAELARDYDTDILALAEPPEDRAALLHELTTINPQFTYLFSPNARVSLFSRLPSAHIRMARDTDILSAWRISSPLEESTLLIVVHMWSKAFLDDYEQQMLTYRIRQDIDELEQQWSTDRTILVGDLNIDPYSQHLSSSEGIHSVMCSRVARRGTRTVKKIDRRMFYNPMWSLLGDYPSGPPGTYFFDRSGHPTNMFWHTFDQVLFRPSLLDEFVFDSLKVITKTRARSLLTADGIPDVATASDHLPIVFSFIFKEKTSV